MKGKCEHCGGELRPMIARVYTEACVPHDSEECIDQLRKTIEALVKRVDELEAKHKL